MFRGWLGLVALSGAWLFLQPVFMPEPRWIPGGAMLAVGVVAILSVQRRARKSALWLTASVLAWQFLALQSLWTLAANHHELPWLSPVLAALARFVGLPATADQGTVFFETEEDVLPFATNWEKLGLIMPVTLLVALTVMALAGTGGWKRRTGRCLGGAALLAAYTLVRYLVLCGWLIEFGNAKGMMETERLALFTGAWPTLLTHVPFAFLAAWMRVPGPALREAPPMDLFARAKLGALAAGAGAVFLGLLAWKIDWPGPAKAGRILVDDAHSGFWEPALPPLTTNGFGSTNIYNCSSLVEWLQHHYPVTIDADQPITEALLRDVDVLVLKTPTKRFTPEEIAVVLAFVRRGGGLLLIGDHTNLLGMGSFLNELAAHFGIRFRFDASNAFSSGYFSSFRPPRLFAHRITEGLPQVRFMTSCTLTLDAGAEPVMVPHDLISDPMDYSKPSFFGKLNPSPRNGFGPFPLAAAARYGDGRVVAYAESTTLSNFAVFQDGTAPFLLRVVSFLNQPQRGRGIVRGLMAALALGLVAFAAWRLRGAGAPDLIGGAGVASLMGCVAAGLALKVWNTAAFPSPAPTLPVERVACLVGPGLNYDIPPAIGPSFIAEAYAFDGMFVMPQRFGAFPSLTRAAELGAGRTRVAVAINPTEAVPAGDLRRMADFVSGGGRLLILQEPGRSGKFLTNLLAQSRAPQLLFERAMSLPSLITNAATLTNMLAGTNIVTLTNAAGVTNSVVVPPAVIEALKPRLLTWSAWSTQSGVVHVLSDSTLFSRAGLGNVMGEPTEPQRRAYDLVFTVFAELLGRVERPPARIVSPSPPGSLQ